MAIEEAREDELLFAEEEEEEEASDSQEACWKLMIVDDEEEVHKVTKMVLRSFTFDGKALAFLDAYSAGEARILLQENHDIALILLDVVMEHDNAGLDFARSIREELANNLVRIVLRTGQPGQAPESEVIRNYDINDYKAKTELTAQKLYTTVIASLRSYRDIMTIEKNKLGLRRIIDASPHIFRLQPLKDFTSGVLSQLDSLLHLNQGTLFFHGFAATMKQDGLHISSASGNFSKGVNRPVAEMADTRTNQLLNRALEEERSLEVDGDFVGYLRGSTGTVNLIYINGYGKLNKWDQDLIQLFLSNVAIGFDNIYLNKEIEDTQSEIVYTLGELAEVRSRETGNHVKRVAEYSELLAIAYGLSKKDSSLLRMASPMHDVGKLGIPDAILNKPGKHTPEEWETMMKHAAIGYDMLKTSKRSILQAAAIVAGQHHEKWDGSGYPHGLKGEEIHIFGRITAVADVFDALSCKRVYKKAWPIDKILDYFREQRGSHFEPKLVDLLLENLDQFLDIRRANTEDWERDGED